MEQGNVIGTGANEMVQQNAVVIQQAAEEILGRATRSQSSDWFDDECKIAVEERKVARLKAKTRSKVAEYKRKKSKFIV